MLYLGMEGHGGPWGSRVMVVLELVRLRVDAPDEEEAGDGGGEEDEDHPQRAHLRPDARSNERINQSNGGCCLLVAGQGEEGRREGNPIQFGALDSEARLCRQPEEEDEAAIFLCAERRKRVYFIVERGARTGLTRSIQSTSSTSVEAVLRLRKQ
jgi:hypothetical protein